MLLRRTSRTCQGEMPYAAGYPRLFPSRRMARRRRHAFSGCKPQETFVNQCRSRSVCKRTCAAASMSRSYVVRRNFGAKLGFNQSTGPALAVLANKIFCCACCAHAAGWRDATCEFHDLRRLDVEGQLVQSRHRVDQCHDQHRLRAAHDSIAQAAAHARSQRDVVHIATVLGLHRRGFCTIFSKSSECKLTYALMTEPDDNLCAPGNPSPAGC